MTKNAITTPTIFEAPVAFTSDVTLPSGLAVLDSRSQQTVDGPKVFTGPVMLKGKTFRVASNDLAYIHSDQQVLVNTPSIVLQGDVNVKNNKIHNLDAGVLPTDAVNVKQLQHVLQWTSTKIDHVDTSVNDRIVAAMNTVVDGAPAVTVAKWQSVANNTFLISDDTPQITYLSIVASDEASRTVSLPSTNISEGKVLCFINLSTQPVIIAAPVRMDFLLGASNRVTLQMGHSITIVHRGAGSYYTQSKNMLLPPTKVESVYNGSAVDIQLSTWSGNSADASTACLKVGTSAITAYVPFAPQAWSPGQIMKTWVFNQDTDGTAVKSCNANSTTEWKTFTVTNCLSSVNGNWSRTLLTLNLDVPYHVTNDGADNFIVEVLDVTDTAQAQTIMRKSQYYDGQGGGGTRACPMFPLVATWRPQYNTGIYTRRVKVQIINQSGGDHVRIGSGVDGGALRDTFNYFTARFEEISV